MEDYLKDIGKVEDDSYGLESAIFADITLSACLSLKYCTELRDENIGHIIDKVYWDPLWKKVRWCDRHPYNKKVEKAIVSCVEKCRAEPNIELDSLMSIASREILL